eukprot:3116320-Pleurochrysis_carterae.AAC.1
MRACVRVPACACAQDGRRLPAEQRMLDFIRDVVADTDTDATAEAQAHAHSLILWSIAMDRRAKPSLSVLSP